MNPIGVLFALTSVAVVPTAQFPLPASNTAPADPTAAPVSNTAPAYPAAPPASNHAPAYPAAALTAADPSALQPRTDLSPWQEFATRPVTIESRYGFGSPVGLIGLAGELSPIPALALGAGAGTNLVGLQLAGWLSGRIVLPSRARSLGVKWARAITLCSGFSEGRYVQFNLFERLTAVDGPGAAPRDYARAYWWNSDLGVEERHQSLVLRVSVGVALLLNPNAGVVDQSSSDERIEPISHTLFYVAAGIGIAP